MKQGRVKLLKARRLGRGMFFHVCRDAEIAAAARPGQFVNVRVSAASAPLLRRPFSIAWADARTGEFSVYFKVVGEGTEALSRASRGDEIDVVGPLGTPFEWAGVEKALLLGGGVGVAPLLFLVQKIFEAKARGEAAPHAVFAYGARDRHGLGLLEDAKRWSDAVAVATEDGARGHKGLVGDLLAPYLDERRVVYCCGPTPMMAAVLAMMRERGLERGWFSLENQMGCGVGVCQGCVVPTRQGYQRVCCDGPVFPASILDFATVSSADAPG